MLLSRNRNREALHPVIDIDTILLVSVFQSTTIWLTHVGSPSATEMATFDRLLD